MQTNALIFGPIAVALLLWLLPFTPRLAGGIALSASIATLIGWIGAVVQFDFKDGQTLQLDSHAVWLEDVGIAYRVGMFDFSLWLIGLTAVVTTAAIAYGIWTRRDHARAYFGLLLFLAGTTTGVFAAQDLIVFYVFFEAMLIPLYVLIGVWGGDGRQGATLKFIVYTMAGSLLMLVSIIALGLQKGTFDMTELTPSNNPAIFLGFMVAFAVKAPMWPFHGWLPDTYREAPPEVAALLSGVISKTATYGMIRIVLPFFPLVVADWQPVVLTLAAIGLVYGSLLAFRAPDIRGVIAYSSLAQMSLIVFGVFAVNVSGLDGALLQMIVHGLVSASFFLLAGMVERRTGHRRPHAPRRHGARAAQVGRRSSSRSA